MALTTPHHHHLHHPHTRSENVVLWALGATVAAAMALGAVLIIDNASNSGTLTPSPSVSTADTGPVSALTGLIPGSFATESVPGFDGVSDAYPWPDRLAETSTDVGASALVADDYPWPDRLAD